MRRRCVDKYDGEMMLGIDVSRWQGEILWQGVRANDPPFKFVICRTGDGRGRDRKFIDNIKGARDAHFRVGSYHYFRADRDGLTQAKLVVDMWEKAGGFEAGKDVPPALDLEEGARKNLPGGVFGGPGYLPIDLVVQEALEFQELIERTLGVMPMIYTGQAFHWWLSQGRPDLAAKFAKYPLWVPSYSSCAKMPVDRTGMGFPWSEWTFWQYTSRGEVKGINGNVDLNRFHGDARELDDFCRSSKESC